VPGAAFVAAVNVTVLTPLPGAAKLAGDRLAVTPAGSPATDKATTALNPLLSVEVALVVPVEPAVTVTAAGETDNANLASAG